MKRFYTVACLVVFTCALHAQDKPTIRILVGFPPGGSVDIAALQDVDSAVLADGSVVKGDRKSVV